MTERIPINIIVAVDSDYGIAKDSKIPWDITEDSNYFHDVTTRSYSSNNTRNAVIMGKTTWKALPKEYRGLKNRINIVISTSMTEQELNEDNTTNIEAYLAKSYSEAIKLCNKLTKNKIDQIFICGGSKIYEEAFKDFDYLYLTMINKSYKCDTFCFIPGFSKDELCVFNKSKILYFEKFKCIDKISTDKVEVTFAKYCKKELYNESVNQNYEEKQYIDILRNIIQTGDYRKTRNANTYCVFNKTMTFDLSRSFPIITTKKVFFRGVFEELIFFLKGDTNSNHLVEKGVKIWEANTSRNFLDDNKKFYKNGEPYKVGDMGPMYGFNWRHFGAEYVDMDHDYTGKGFDQLNYCINLIKKDPTSRRIIMTTFNPANANEGVLYPCHGISIQFCVEDGSKLSCMMVQRSADEFCGIPFNLSSYSLLVYFLCEVINNDDTYKGPKLSPGRLIMEFGDTHLYEEHYTQAIRQILREPYKFPKLKINRKVTDITDFKFEDLELVDYTSYPNIPARMIA